MAASPPYSPAGSPPYPSHAQLPSKKRGSTAGDLPGSAAKRRKASVMSAASTTSAHPLRQTSFPPDESQSGTYSPSYKRSPSVDTMSLVSGSQISGAPAKKKRGRKSKAERAKEEAEQAARGGSYSAAGGPTGSVVSNGGTGKRGSGGDDDDDGDEVPENMASEAASRTKEQIEREHRIRASLKQRMNEEQFRRYEQWHKTVVPVAAVRKYINSVSSQSVTQSIPQAMQVVCKLFVGDIVEEARRVQQEWIIAGEKQVPDDIAAKEENKPENLSEVQKHRRQAPLRPDHFQEAYRRWKRSNVGGGSGGSLMVWNQQTHNGLDRFAPRAGGKRLFK